MNAEMQKVNHRPLLDGVALCSFLIIHLMHCKGTKCYLIPPLNWWPAFHIETCLGCQKVGNIFFGTLFVRIPHTDLPPYDRCPLVWPILLCEFIHPRKQFLKRLCYTCYSVVVVQSFNFFADIAGISRINSSLYPAYDFSALICHYFLSLF